VKCNAQSVQTLDDASLIAGVPTTELAEYFAILLVALLRAKGAQGSGVGAFIALH
jgi:hypothetical protein